MSPSFPAPHAQVAVVAARDTWFRLEATLRRVWYLLPEEQGELSSHFLLRSTAATLMAEVATDTEDHCKDKIQIGRITFDVECLLTTLEELADRPYLEVLISGRVINSRNFAVALVQPRYASLKQEKWESIKEWEV